MAWLDRQRAKMQLQLVLVAKGAGFIEVDATVGIVLYWLRLHVSQNGCAAAFKTVVVCRLATEVFVAPTTVACRKVGFNVRVASKIDKLGLGAARIYPNSFHRSFL